MPRGMASSESLLNAKVKRLSFKKKKKIVIHILEFLLIKSPLCNGIHIRLTQ